MENNRVSATSIHKIYYVDLLWGDINAGNKFCISQAAVYKLSPRQTRQSVILSTDLHSALGGHLARSISNLSNFLGWVMGRRCRLRDRSYRSPGPRIFNILFDIYRFYPPQSGIAWALRNWLKYWTVSAIFPSSCGHRKCIEDRIPFDGRFSRWKIIFSSVRSFSVWLREQIDGLMYYSCLHVELIEAFGGFAAESRMGNFVCGSVGEKWWLVLGC